MNEKIIAMMRRDGTRIFMIAPRRFHDIITAHTRENNFWRPFLWGEIIRYHKWIYADKMKLRRLGNE